jgi:peptidyl-prolyl cis-trans isomerase B (cyclophilin B)
MPLLRLACVVLALSAPASAQLAPTRLYYGIHRAMPMSISVPAGSQGEVVLELYEPPPLIQPDDAQAPKPLMTAPAVPGLIDLATHFPLLWATESPRVLYAQLNIGGEPVGPPVVLEPMVTPNTAALVDRATFAPVADPAAGVLMFDDERIRNLETAGKRPEPRLITYSGIRAYVDKHIVLETSLGRIEFRLRPDQAPITAWNFRQLVEGGFYTDVIFHRVVANTDVGAPFVIQTGDPDGSGEGGPGYHIDLEASRLPHDFGTLSMARDTDPNTNGSQVFVALSREATARLDGRYTAFGQAVSGAETIIAIEGVELLPEDPGVPGQPPPRPRSRPKDPPVIRSAALVDAPPFGRGPAPLRRPAPAVPR